MPTVKLEGNEDDIQALMRAAQKAKAPLHWAVGAAPHDARVVLNPRRMAPAYRVLRDEGVWVSVADAAELSKALHVDAGEYMLMQAATGLLQLRALQLNPVLQFEDFLHADPHGCLLAETLFYEEHADRLKNPTICPGCRNFYRSLCPDEEFHALDGIIRAFARKVRPENALNN